jgi:hypothetical protein
VSQFIEAIKAGWQVYTLIGVLLTTGVAFAGVPTRVSSLEQRMERQETVSRYTACVLKYQSDGTDPRACESHLSPDILDFLRPKAAR